MRGWLWAESGDNDQVTRSRVGVSDGIRFALTGYAANVSTCG